MANYGTSHSPRSVSSLPPNAGSFQIIQKINELVLKLRSFFQSPFEVTTATQLVAKVVHIPNHASTRVVFTLPVGAAQGDRIIVRGKGAAGWKVAQNAGQTIHGATDSTAGVTGFIQSGARYNCVELMCITQDTDFVIATHEGTITIS